MRRAEPLVAVVGRLLLPGETAGVDLGEDIELDQTFQLGAGALDVLRQQFVVEGFAAIAGPERTGDLDENSEDAWVVRVLGQVGRAGLGGDPVREAGDGLPGDRQVFEKGLSLPQSGLQFGDLRPGRQRRVTSGTSDCGRPNCWRRAR
ncbi:hypothetical protein [Streptomyces sp. NPDC030920]|uniref:hypothetical protein n=1 Tax=Streptomyces sp. NPDC030920 TaxID=3365308 RepID=UPI00384CCC7A